MSSAGPPRADRLVATGAGAPAAAPEVARNAGALIRLVDDDAAARVAAVLQIANDEAARIRREAHARARSTVKAAYEDERRRHRDRVAAAQAALDTRRRLALQQRNAALVDAGLAALPGALRARWADADGRAAWVAQALAQARAVLPRTTWEVVHPVAWAGAERAALADAIERATGHAPSLAGDATLQAGLAIGAQGTRVDARLAGLLADRARIGARLLHHADAAAREDEA